MDALGAHGAASKAPDMVREANHRIANHLTLLASMVQLQIESLKGGPELLDRRSAADQLRAVAARVVAIGNLHRRLAGSSMDLIDLAAFLPETCAELVGSLGLDDRVQVKEEIATDCILTPEETSVVSLVLSEIIINALKYAHPTGLPVLIRIACAHSTSGIAVEISDDGIGLPENFDEGKHSGVGFKLMRGLLQKINAELDYESCPLGLTFRFTIPRSTPSH